jgi:hypothetical protein
VTSPETLVLLAARLRGRVTAVSVAHRYVLDAQVVEEVFLDLEAHGWIGKVSFDDLKGWAITARGRERVNELVRVELKAAGCEPLVEATHEAFQPLNRRALDAVTRWQIRPMPWDRMARNDHDDPKWDGAVLDDLEKLTGKWRALELPLAARLARFSGYAARLDAAVERANDGHTRWVDEPGIESFHMVWFELHEDLLLTLGRERGT